MQQKRVPNKDDYEGIPTETQMIIRQNSSFCLRRLSQNENFSFLLQLGTPHFGLFLISFFFSLQISPTQLFPRLKKNMLDKNKPHNLNVI